MRRNTKFVSVVVAMLALAIPAIATATPNEGNSAAARACQDDGYKTLATFETQTVAFTSDGACTSYAAKGGDLTPLSASNGSGAGGGKV